MHEGLFFFGCLNGNDCMRATPKYTQLHTGTRLDSRALIAFVFNTKAEGIIYYILY